MENLCECLYIYLNTHLVLKVCNVNILLAIFTSISPCLEFSIKCTYYIYRVGQLSFLSFFFFNKSLFHWHVGPHFSRTYHWKQLENAISEQMKPGIINLNK